MKQFKLHSPYKAAGDQPKAIETLTKNAERGAKEQVLLGVTGSGKTYTMANVIANLNKPTLIISHNKTLAAQLYQEFRDFSRKMQYPTLFHTMIIISRKHMSHKQIHI